MNFETTKKIVESKLNNVEAVPLNKKMMTSDALKIKLQSSPSIDELKKKFLSKNTSDNVQESSNTSSSSGDDIGVIKIRSKEQGADISESLGERTIIVKNNDILGAQG